MMILTKNLQEIQEGNSIYFDLNYIATLNEANETLFASSLCSCKKTNY